MAEFLTTDGVSLHYEVEGREDGPALVLANSLGTSLGLWDGQVGEGLYRGFRLIRYDPRGHGLSETPDGPYSVARLAQDIVDLLDSIGVEQSSFCGMSMGAATGIELAKSYPRRVARAAFCNTTVWMPDKELWSRRIAAVAEGGMTAVAEEHFSRWFTREFREENPDEAERIKAMLLDTDPKGYAGCAAALRDMDLRDRLGLIEASVLVVVGTHDEAATPAQGQYIVERVPGAQKLALHSAHLSNVEARDAFNQSVFAFLTGERL